MKTANFQYRCRRCGEINRTIDVAETAALALMIKATFREADQPPLISVLHCPCHAEHGDGSSIGDLVGFEVTEKP